MITPLPKNKWFASHTRRGVASHTQPPASWETLAQCVQDPSIRLFHLARQAHVKKAYDDHMAAQQYKNYSDYIRTHTMQGQRRALTLNTFPYNIAEGIYHYNIWSIEPLTEAETQTEIQKHFKQDVHWFVNEPEMRSVPEVWHCHVFTKERLKEVDS